MAVPLPVLPKGCTATFVGEGNANVVFAITLPASAENGALFRGICDARYQIARVAGSDGILLNPGRLLRVPKAGTKAYPYRQTQAYWEEHIAPLFDQSDLVGQSLVDLTGSDIVSHLNHILSEKDKVRSNGWSRRPEFIGSRVAEVDIGMLVEDMRKRKPNIDQRSSLLDIISRLASSNATTTRQTFRCRP